MKKYYILNQFYLFKLEYFSYQFYSCKKSSTANFNLNNPYNKQTYAVYIMTNYIDIFRKVKHNRHRVNYINVIIHHELCTKSGYNDCVFPEESTSIEKYEEIIN